MGMAVKSGEQMESKSPVKALLPVAIFCLLPTSRDHNCLLAKARLMQCAARRCCPSLPRGGLLGNTAGLMADTLERGQGTAGDTSGQV